MFFASWLGLVRVIVVGVCAYVALVVLLRVSGKRTLSKMNAFDFVVTVALGSTLGSLLLSKDVPLAEGVAAFGLLIGLQLVATWASVRSERLQQLLKSQPTLLVLRGALLENAMARERVTAEEVRAAVREHGLASLDEVGAVVLETTGELSVIGGPLTDTPSSLEGVRREQDGDMDGEDTPASPQPRSSPGTGHAARTASCARHA